MRRKEREIADWDDIVQILDKCDVIRIGLVDDGVPYIVPLNFGLDYADGQAALFFHSALEGRKVDILRKNPYVCFEADTSFQLKKSDEPCKWSAGYESVVGYGTVEFLEDLESKKAAMDRVMKKYGYPGEPVYPPEVFARTLLCRLSVESMSGKRNSV